jgi:hypothetical protein
MREISDRRFLSTPKCRSAFATTLPTPPAALALINPEVVRRELMPVATMAGDFGAAGLAALLDVRKRNHERTISRNHAPATTDYISSYNSVGYTH